MPRLEYRNLAQLPAATADYDKWINWLDQQFANKDITHRSEVVRDVLTEIYYGQPAQKLDAANLSAKVAIHSLDPRNTTLEPEYYGDADAQKYAERKPLILAARAADFGTLTETNPDHHDNCIPI